MTYRGGLPPDQAYDGRRDANPQYHLYDGSSQAGYQYQPMQQPGMGYMAPQQPYPAAQQQPFPAAQQLQYPMNNLPPMQPHNLGYDNNVNFTPPAQYAQPLYPSAVPPPMSTYPAAAIAQPMPPPQTHVPVPVPRPSSTSNPKPVPNRRISSQGAIQKPTNSPRPSPTLTPIAKSPTPAPRSLADPTSLLICIADECLTKARSIASQTASSRDVQWESAYHKLISTGLGCLDAALQTGKLSPRKEVLVRLRYGSLLCEETDNLMEAETCLNSAIKLCEKHRLTDLKLYAQYLFMKVLFRRNPRAAHIALDAHIADCVTYKQAYWIYAFRFLKASFYLQTASATEAHTTDNLRSISALASQRNDKAVCVLAALLEGLLHLKAGRDDTVVRVQTCIAQASKYQLDSSVQIPQLVILTRLLDLACSLLQKLPDLITAKLKALQECMDGFRGAAAWGGASSELLLPLRKHSTSSPTISSDTAVVVRVGDEELDYLVLRSFTKAEGLALGHSITGLASLFRTGGPKPFEFWAEGLKALAAGAKAASTMAISLQEALLQERWRIDLQAYIYIMIGLHSATRTEWQKVGECNQKLRRHKHPTKAQPPLEGSLATLAAYLQGAHDQGVGDLDSALQIFSDARFSIDEDEKSPRRDKRIEFRMSLLAALNRILIMQDKNHRDDQKTTELVETLKRYCVDCDDVDIRGAYHVAMAIIESNPPLSITDMRRNLHIAIQSAKSSNNVQCLSMALNTMRYRLFEDHVGEQAVKSAKAAKGQAMKSGNTLWLSVSEFLCSKSYESSSQAAEAKQCFEAGTQYANESWARTQYDAHQ